MAESEEIPPAVASDVEPPARRRRWWLAALAGVVVLLAIVLGYLWATRETIAGNLIEAELERLELPATYKIERIGPRRQILTDIVIGDPRRPDLTVARATVFIRHRFGFPTIGRIVAERPRLYGTWRGGKPSFGSLDKVLFGGPKQPFRFPDLDVAIHDGRALIESDYGPVGIKLDGAGKLRGGFAGVLAAVAPNARFGECEADGASVYAKVTIAAEKPRLVGPMRVAELDCPGQRIALRRVALEMDATLDPHLDGGEGKFKLATGSAAYAANRATGLGGATDLVWRGGKLSARYDLLARGLESGPVTAATLSAAGTLRAIDDFARIEADGTIDGGGVRLGPGLDATLASAQRSAADTLLGPMIAQVRDALQREGRNSRLAAQYSLRKTGKVLNLVVPQGSLTGGSGATLLALSRFQLVAGETAAPRVAGNFSTGGAGLPRIVGRLERQDGGQTLLRMAMAEYRAGNGVLAVPQLALVQRGDGAIGFAGEARLSGPLPGGSAQNLVIPLDGNWSGRGDLALWRSCVPVHFDRLTVSNLTIERRGLTVCPGPGGAIVRSGAGGLKVAAGASSLDVAGRLGQTPIRIVSGPVGYASPGALFARQLDVALGPAATATRIRLNDVTATVGEEIVGKFAGTDAKLYAVPLDLLDASGNWRLADGRLSISDGSFRLVDRREIPRFEPLAGRGGSLTLANNVIVANAKLHNPATDRLVTEADIRHDLATGTGHADLAVPGIVFDAQLQPTALSRLALGTIANARGAVRGAGRIDWSPRGVTSTGQYTTDNLDFAAAFGPVRGASGTVVFTDLIGMVTAPDQQLRVASMNPGIEVTDGVLTFELRRGAILAVKGATWPFLGGTLTLEATNLALGVSEVRRYTLRVEGLDAALFVARMELANISATGKFDGVLPLVFDTAGGRVVGGFLQSRPPGGNVSYVGALTYKDLSPMANMAFDALKSLDYRHMTIAMDGNLTGEIVTRVRFDGVSQGAGAERNFITDRIGKLPIQMNVNVRAPFYQLITSFRSMNDPKFIRDPRAVGLLDSQGNPIDGEVANPPLPAIKPDDIQPPVSEKRP